MSETIQREDELFQAASKLSDTAQRESFLRAACHEDSALHARLNERLASNEATMKSIEPLPSSSKLPPTVDHEESAQSGKIIAGKYKLLSSIGEGGMGTVWMAEQRAPVKRLVAIKLIKAGMDSKLVLARFENERQALALMDHPNIARILDGGITESGSPYFVMELVKGVPITEFCDARRLTPQQRLELFVPVCHAIQHAHQKGIIHRDIKPSNVMVSLYDDKPVPKVIDFGVAKATGQALTEHTLNTGFSVVGTPQYMSPEQATFNQIDIDTRSDIYSLGVLLYELLAGSTPFEKQELQKAGYLEILRVIREDEPPRPSTKLSTAKGLPSISATRSTEPKRLTGMLRNELDWIVMKSLEKDRSRRYETANAFAADIGRYLTGEAVQAHPPSQAYRMQKFLLKHKGKVTAALALLLTLLLGIGGTALGFFRAIKSEQYLQLALVQVTKERDEKEIQRKIAEMAAKSATQAKQLEANQRDIAERQLISGLLRPIGYGDKPSSAELRSFVEWASISDERLKFRVLQIALEDPEAAMRIARRVKRTIQACVGLSPTRREKAIAIVSTQQHKLSASPPIRAAACWIAAELGANDLPGLSDSISYFIASLPTGNEPAEEFVGFLSTVLPRFELLSSRELSSVVDELILVLEKSHKTSVLKASSTGLVSLATHLSQEQWNRAWDAIIGVLENAESTIASEGIGSELIAFISHLPAENVTLACDTLLSVLENSRSSSAMRVIVDGLVQLVPRLSPEQITQGWDLLISMPDKSSYRFLVSGEVLAAMAPRLLPEQTGRGGDMLISVIENSPDNYCALSAAGAALIGLAPRLTLEQRTRCGNALITAIEKALDAEATEKAIDGLKEFLPNLLKDEISRGCDSIIGLLEKSRDGYTLRVAIDGAVDIAPFMSPEQLTRAIDAVIGVFQKSRDGYSLGRTGNAYALAASCDGLSSFADRMTLQQVTLGWDLLIGVFEEATDANELKAAGNCLSALAIRLPQEQLLRSIDMLIGLLENPKCSHALENTSKGLAALAPRLTFEQLTRGGKPIIEAIELSQDKEVSISACKSLLTMAEHLPQEQLLHCIDLLVEVIMKSSSPELSLSVEKSFAVLASRLSSEQSMHVGNKLIDVLKITKTGYNRVAVRVYRG